MPKLPFLRVLIDDEPQSGAWNMAVDEVLLETAIERDLATLRFYRWREATLSLGYFQKDAERLAVPRLTVLPWVRRITGGGTLVHHHELTYSLTLPASQRLVERPMELYDLVHNGMVDVMSNLGVPLSPRGVTRRESVEPFLCFSREDEHDLIVSGHKVLGSAQRRRRGALLQHGSLLLRGSEWTPDLPGVTDLAPTANLSGFEGLLTDSLWKLLADNTFRESLTEAETNRTCRLLGECHAGQGHNQDRNINQGCGNLQPPD